MKKLLREYVQTVLREVEEDEDAVRALENRYGVFHISSQDLGDRFTFTPRLPSTPMRDENGDVIEDMTTLRTSWAPRIWRALSALGGAQRQTMYIYAVEKLPKQVFPSADPDECPSSEPDNEYGPGFVWKDYQGYVEKIIKRGLTQADKDRELTKCVPDVEETEEIWSTGPVTAQKVGIIQKGVVRLYGSK